MGKWATYRHRGRAFESAGFQHVPPTPAQWETTVIDTDVNTAVISEPPEYPWFGWEYWADGVLDSQMPFQDVFTPILQAFDSGIDQLFRIRWVTATGEPLSDWSTFKHPNE